MEDRPDIIVSSPQPNIVTNPAINPETGLIDRVPSAQELRETYGSKARAMHDAEVPTTTPENTNPILHSPTSIGHPGPKSPWGPTEFTGNYKRIPHSDDLMVQVGTAHDEEDPMSEQSRVAWIPLSQIHSGNVTWRTSDFPGSGELKSVG